MTCSAAEPYLLDDEADLPPDVRAHFDECADCRRLRQDLRETQAMLRDHLATPAPETLRPAFAAHLEEAKRDLARDRPPASDRGAVRSIGRRVRWAAAFAVVFILGAMSMVWLQPRDGAEEPTVLAQLESDSPSERLAGVMAASMETEEAPERSLVDALLITLLTDPSVNVRVAALDALSAYGDRERVRLGVLRALAADSEPLVQMAALRFVEAHQPPEASQALGALLSQPDLEPLVRSQAEILTVSI
ncbi:MAG: HEAT repeat domain-containing protein [Bacteroidota bacterium]